MAVKSRSSSAWHVLHFMVRFIGLLGVTTAIGGWFVWGILRFEEFGLIAIAGGLGALGFALLFEVPGFLRLVFSNRGVFGFNSALQILLALGDRGRHVIPL